MRTIQRDIVGVFLVSSDQQILLGKSRKGGVYQGAWVVPGGGIEEDETKLQAVQRETREEVGIDITNERTELLDLVHTGSSEKVLRDTGEHVVVDMTFYNFLVSFERPAADIAFRCEDDIAEARWFPIVELSQLQLSAPTVVTLTHLGYL